MASGELDLTGGVPLSQTWSIASPPALGTATIDPATGEWTYEVDPTDFEELAFGEIVEDTFTVRVIGNEVDPTFTIVPYNLTQSVTITIEGVCFTAGTLIETSDGSRPIETLGIGCEVITADHGPQPIRWIESSYLTAERLKETPSLRPVRIRAGSLGPNVPRRDLVVSQQHRILIRGPTVELLFGASEALVAAKHLCSWPGIDIETSHEPVEYLHILLDRHEILTAEGAPAESLFLGEEALHAISSEALQELAAIFPDQGMGTGLGASARLILREHEARALTPSPA